MNTHTQISPLFKRSLLLPLLLGIQASSLSAAEYVWTNPTLQTNTGSIYTQAKITEAENASTRASVLSSDGFGAVQVWSNTGTNWLAGSALENGLKENDGIMAFSSNLLPDVRFSFSGNVNNQAGSQVTNSSFASAPGASSAMRLVPGTDGVTPVSTTLTIDFGSWNGTTFNSGSNAVSSAAFTLTTGADDRWAGVISLSVLFLDSGGNTLSSQGIPAGFPPITTSSSLFFGYASESDDISSIQITLEGTNNQLFGFDEFGFSSIPEPASTGVAISSLALLLVASRRCIKRP